MKFAKLAKIFGGIIALVIVVLLLAPLFISADYLKTQLMAQVKSATGRELIIKGKTSFALFPNIAVSAEDVTLGNPAGFKSPYLVHLDKLATGAALRPLLSDSLSINGVTLEGATIYLEQLASGTKNWEFAKANAETTETTPASKNEAKAINNIAIGDISIRQSDITVMKPAAPDMAVKNITVLITGADGSKPLKLSGNADYKGQSMTLDVAIAKSREFLAQKMSPLVLTLAMPGGSLKFAGDASLEGGASVKGKLETVIDSLPEMLSWASGKPSTGGLPESVRVQTALEVKNPQSIALNDLTATFDGISATGKLAVALGGNVPAITGALQLAELDMNKLPGKSRSEANTSSSTGANSIDTGWSDARIDLSGLRAVNANLALKIGALKTGKLELQNIVANAALNSGVLKIALANAGLYGGSAKGNIYADGSGSAASIASDLALNGIQIEPLMSALSGASRLSGTANLALNVRGQGASQRAIVNTLAGNGSLSVADGAVKGINLAQFLREAKKGFLADGGSEKTDFTALGGTFTIAQGIVSNKDFLMKAPIVSATGQGTVALPGKTVNYRLTPIIAGNVKGQGGELAQGLEIPLLISGPWANPSITPDLVGALQKGLADPAALKQNIRGIKDSLKNGASVDGIGKALLGGGNATSATKPTETPAKPSKNDALIQGVGGLLQGFSKP